MAFLLAGLLEEMFHVLCSSLSKFMLQRFWLSSSPPILWLLSVSSQQFDVHVSTHRGWDNRASPGHHRQNHDGLPDLVPPAVLLLWSSEQVRGTQSQQGTLWAESQKVLRATSPHSGYRGGGGGMLEAFKMHVIKIACLWHL